MLVLGAQHVKQPPRKNMYMKEESKALTKVNVDVKRKQ